MSPHLDAVRDLTADGMIARDISRLLGITASYVHKLRSIARREYGHDCMDRN